MCNMIMLPFLALALPDNTGRATVGAAASTSNISSDYSIISRGGICVKHNWIDLEQIAGLRRDISYLRNQPFDATEGTGFQPSGLSNRVAGDENLFGASDRLTCTITSHLGGNRQLRAAIDEKLEGLKLELQEALGIISNDDNQHGDDGERGLELAEQYYSISPERSFLPRHMDERHEQTKGAKGWINESRRSISWLLYLNDHNWGSPESNNSGGELRTYCRRSNSGTKCGSYEGDIQVGWLPSSKHREEFDPIFLDSWVKTPTIPATIDEEHSEDDHCIALQWQPLSALYRLVEGNNSSQAREYLSNAFGPDSPSWPSDTNLDATEFAAALASQLSRRMQNDFISTEAIHDQPTDILPTGGTLILFDSVAIPHEVLPTERGERLALAGWFHESQQSFPEWYGT